jgi:adenosylhomocysteine nucleosidase
MKSSIVIVAALPREIAPLVRGNTADPKWRKRGVWMYRLPQAIIVAAGMGADRATLAMEAALRDHAASLVVSTGLAGSCSAELKPGEVVEARTVVDALTGERWSAEASGGVVLATGSAIADVREKRRLRESYGASMVDMEAATVARLAAARGVPFRAIKGISDAHDFELASLAAFTGPRGEFRTAAFALHTALRPGRWAATMKLGKDSAQAIEELSLALRRLIGS